MPRGKSKGGAGSKSKGARFERGICQRLSLWATGLTSEDVFWRSAMSGGRSTNREKAGRGKITQQAGDITAIDPVGAPLLDRFCIECKFYKGLELSEAYGSQAKLTTFLQQAQRATPAGVDWMLILKTNNRPEMVFVSDDGFSKIKAAVRFGRTLTPSVRFPRIRVVGVPLTAVLAKVSYAKLCTQ